ncbi:MAG: hypothetical protein IBX49_08695 [Gammaproteobacteria bacterium]|nr:hypothetical protein [Gammaproteobacteria bacterium]
MAISGVIINSVLDIGLESIVGKRNAFFNFTSSFIRGDHPLPLDNTPVMLDTLEDMVTDEPLIAGMRELARQKYIIALAGCCCRSGECERRHCGRKSAVYT